MTQTPYAAVPPETGTLARAADCAEAMAAAAAEGAWERVLELGSEYLALTGAHQRSGAPLTPEEASAARQAVALIDTVQGLAHVRMDELRSLAAAEANAQRLGRTYAVP